MSEHFCLNFGGKIYTGSIEVLINIEQFSDLFKPAFNVIVMSDKMCPCLPWPIPIFGRLVMPSVINFDPLLLIRHDK